MSDDHIAINRAAWNAMAADFYDPGHRSWASPAPHWGELQVPESELHLLPADLQDRDVVELGCGTAYVSACMARRAPGGD